MWAHKPHTKRADMNARPFQNSVHNSHNPNTGARNLNLNLGYSNKVENLGQSAVRTSEAPLFYNTSGDHNNQNTNSTSQRQITFQDNGDNNTRPYGPRNVDNAPA